MNENEIKFQEIFNEYQPKILRYLTGMVGEQFSEDLTQEVFMKVNKNIEKFKGDSKLSTWIYRIATNTAIDKLRSKSYKQEQHNTESIENIEDDKSGQLEDKSKPVEKQLIQNEMDECIKKYINDLPENYSIVLTLKEIEGFKNKEIAEILGISLEAVKIRLHRAKEKLKDMLKEQCNFYRNDCNQLSCDQK